jgi:hypothetical protein
VQWSRRLPELLARDVRLVLVSVGRPEVGRELVEHLGFRDGNKYLFVDPTNALYDALDLNRGVRRTFFSADTAFAFLDRFARKDGTKDLQGVLSKWSKGESQLAPRR